MRALTPLLLFLACAPRPDGDYFCVTGGANYPGGLCTASESQCTDRLRASGSQDPALHCEKTHTTAYKASWTHATYGAMEAWYVDAATCERNRRGGRCELAPWKTSGWKSH